MRRSKCAPAANLTQSRAILLPVRDGDDGRNAKVARHIEHPQAASHCGVPGAQIPKVIVA